MTKRKISLVTATLSIIFFLSTFGCSSNSMVGDIQDTESDHAVETDGFDLVSYVLNFVGIDYDETTGPAYKDTLLVNTNYTFDFSTTETDSHGQPIDLANQQMLIYSASSYDDQGGIWLPRGAVWPQDLPLDGFIGNVHSGAGDHFSYTTPSNPGFITLFFAWVIYDDAGLVFKVLVSKIFDFTVMGDFATLTKGPPFVTGIYKMAPDIYVQFSARTPDESIGIPQGMNVATLILHLMKKNGRDQIAIVGSGYGDHPLALNNAAFDVFQEKVGMRDMVDENGDRLQPGNIDVRYPHPLDHYDHGTSNIIPPLYHTEGDRQIPPSSGIEVTEAFYHVGYNPNFNGWFPSESPVPITTIGSSSDGCHDELSSPDFVLQSGDPFVFVRSVSSASNVGLDLRLTLLPGSRTATYLNNTFFIPWGEPTLSPTETYRMVFYSTGTNTTDGQCGPGPGNVIWEETVHAGYRAKRWHYPHF